jgi:hypothetical protein
MDHQLNQKAFFQNGKTIMVLLRGRNARLPGPGMMLQNKCKKHYRDSSNNITFFPFEQEKIGKNVMMKTISNALRRFRHALNKYYV